MVDDTPHAASEVLDIPRGPGGKMGKTTVSYPGGCDIGQRPIDQHLRGCPATGVVFRKPSNIMRNRQAPGADIHLDIPSVGATENIMMCAAMADG